MYIIQLYEKADSEAISLT